VCLLGRHGAGVQPVLCACCSLSCVLPPSERSTGSAPQRDREVARPVLKELSFVSEADKGEQAAIRGGKRPRFAGHQTLDERAESFRIAEKMHVHCG